jgi:hypothetical protein
MVRAMLFSPDFHEPLTERAWDESWVRAQIDVIAEDALGAIGADGLWPVHPDDYDDDDVYLHKGLYLGAAGVVWALHVLGRSHPELIRGLHSRYLAEPDWPGTVEPGYLVGEAGILLAAQFLEPDAAGADLLEQAIRRNAGNETNELLWGAPGTMLAALAMHGATGEPRWADAWRASADELWARWLPSAEPDCHLWSQQLFGTTSVYIGPGHGFAGNVRALWLGRELLEDERVVELERRAIATTQALAVREDGLANWAPTVGPLAHRGRIRAQWCHGAPGMVTSLASLGAADEAFGALLLAAGELTWRAGPLATGVGLCHGTAGNGVAFLALFERTGEALWLDRARRFAVHALEQVARERSKHEFGRHTLWTGDLGAAVVAMSCIEGRPGMPSLDWI